MDNQNFEKIGEDPVETKVKELERSAMHDDVYVEYTKKINEIILMIDGGGYVSDLEKQELIRMQENLASSTVSFTSLSEFKKAVEVYYSGVEADEIVAHENAHMNIAESLGVEAEYGVALTKTEAGLGFYSTVKLLAFPVGMSKKDQIKSLIAISSAPDSYGEENSDNDKLSVVMYGLMLEEILANEK